MKPITLIIQPRLWAIVGLLMLAAGGFGYWAGQQITTSSDNDEDAFGNYLAAHPDALQPAISKYMQAHPEALTDMIASLLKKESGATSEQPTVSPAIAITQNEQALLHSPHQVTLGDPEGQVTLVEFFDYNCGYCKRALPDMLGLLETDPHLRIVLKEYPILGPDSLAASRVAIAVRMQDKDGKLNLAFHRLLLEGHGTADGERAKAIAKSLGADMKRLEADLASAEVTATLDQSSQLALALNIGGTPSYVLGRDILSGAIGIEALRERIALLR